MTSLLFSHYVSHSHERHGFTNHQLLHFLFIKLFRLIRNKTSRLHITGPLWGEFRSQLPLLTLDMRGPSYLGLTRSISWFLVTWLLGSPGHQQPWYWSRKLDSSMRRTPQLQLPGCHFTHHWSGLHGPLSPSLSASAEHTPGISLPNFGKNLAGGNPTLWPGVSVAPIKKSFGSSEWDWNPSKKLLIPCKVCTNRFIRYSSTYYGKVSHRFAHDKYKKSWLFCLPGGECRLVCCSSAMLSE